MICPYRKQTETTNDGTVSEYYMECYGHQCPFYIPENLIGSQAYCNKVEKIDPNAFSPELDRAVAEAILVITEKLPEIIPNVIEALVNVDWNDVAREAAIIKMREAMENAGDNNNSDNMRNIGDDLMDQ